MGSINDDGKKIANLIIKCPHCLRERNMATSFLLPSVQNDDDEWESDYYCLKKCGDCKNISLFYFSWSSKTNAQYEENVVDEFLEWKECGYCESPSMLTGANLQKLYPTTEIDYLISCKEIKKVSPDFVLMYEQAYKAEKNNLIDLCGMGYRKSLEILITDFVLYKSNPGEKLKKEVMRLNLMEKIKRYFNDDNDFLTCAERATWIGNDETHLVRKHTNVDIQNMKELIYVLFQRVRLKVLADEYLDKMPKVNK